MKGKNEVHTKIEFYLIHETDMDQDEFRSKFHQDTLAAGKVEFKINGQTYQASIMEVIKPIEILFVDEDGNEEVTESADSVTNQEC